MSARLLLAGCCCLVAACGATDGASPLAPATTDSTGLTVAVDAPDRSDPVSDPDSPPESPPQATPVTTGAPAPIPPAEGLALCSQVARVTTDVVGTLGGVANGDPVFQGVIRTYANEHAGTFGGMWIDRDAGGTFVVAFTDDPASHRFELASRRPLPTDDVGMEPPPPITDDRPIGEWDEAFDVVRVQFSEQELLAAMERLQPLMTDGAFPGNSMGLDTFRNRIALFSEPVTPAILAELSERVHALVPTDMVCLEAELVAELPTPIEPGTPLDVIELPGADGRYPPDTPVECGGGGFRFELGAIQPLLPLDDADRPELVEARDEAIEIGEGNFGPTGRDWYVLRLTDAQATLIAPGLDGIAMLPFEMTDAGWQVVGYSFGGADCEIRRLLPDGYGAVEWELDPAFPAPGPDTAEVHVLATELACAGARNMGDQLLGPDVSETDDAIRIAFAVIPLTGAQPCPGNPSTAVTIDLSAPLGDREIRDGLLIGSFGDLARYP